MAKAFTTWTVLRHDPIEKLTDNLWRVRGYMRGGKTQRQMMLARMTDGRILVHNAIALDGAEMKELEAWGTPAVIFVPNGYHRQDALIWKQRYPDALVVAPAGARKRVEQVVPVGAVTEDAPRDATVALAPIPGMPGESVLEVRSGDDVSVVFCDAIMNLPKIRLPMRLLLGPTGKVAAPRFARWVMMKDKRAVAAYLDRLAETPGLRRVLVAHGRPITVDAPGALRAVARQLRGE
jgi:hypothetical protein